MRQYVGGVMFFTYQFLSQVSAIYPKTGHVRRQALPAVRRGYLDVYCRGMRERKSLSIEGDAFTNFPHRAP